MERVLVAILASQRVRARADCMNSRLFRSATCIMVTAEAELISPINTVAPS